jgi:hypothetical protein
MAPTIFVGFQSPCRLSTFAILDSHSGGSLP